jgi:hypothetical protein
MDQQKQLPKIEKEEGCDVKFKRDKQGRVTGFSAKGKCTKEHLRMATGSIGETSEE